MLQIAGAALGDAERGQHLLVVAVAASGVIAFSHGPLWIAARWNRPLAAGMAIRVATLPPPPLWPKIVTRPGSPPKASMLSLHPLQREDQVQLADVAAVGELRRARSAR